MRHIDYEERVAYLEFRNGTVMRHALSDHDDGKQDDSLLVGDVLLVGPRWDDIDFGAPELWPDETYLATVRKVLGEEVVVDGGLRLRTLLAPEGVDLTEGNTVEVSELSGIRRVVTEGPIDHSLLRDRDSVDLSLFKQTPTESLSLDHFGGNPTVKERAHELIGLRLQNAEKFEKINARPIKGVLFSGPSGTGKTMLARIIASTVGAEFYLISGPQIFSKWYGQSEEVIRAIFTDAGKQKRAVVVFDEIDSVASQRNEESHEASKRVVGQLLTTMDGFSQRSNVIVVATTNRPDDLDIALRRPGRFDWEIRFELPRLEDRMQILKTSASGLNVENNLPYERIASLTDGWSSAHLTAIWSEASILAVKDGRDCILSEDCIGGYERVAVLHSLMATAAAKTNPEKQ
ncbi:ATP-binding protein [Dactylosporangium sp. NPDC048998]|uniref:ATP-binding protein n=1 Tax=Dactylosporangium sp. NPDC048998 TaxID=3363976 RepID=UPI00371A4D9A